MKIAAAYIRVSTDEQVEFSPDSQIKKIREYAKQHDLLIPEEYIFKDEGISGRTAEKRPAFQKMIGLSKVKPKPFDVIIVWKFSRFARNREDSIVYKSLLKKQGIDVVSVSEQLADDNSAVLMAAIYEAMDEYYSLNLAEEVKRGMKEKFSRGGITAQAPIGYKVKNGTYIPDAEKAPVIKKIFEDFVSGEGYRAIARKLNDIGMRTSYGNTFGNRNIEYIITNPVYTGRVRMSKVIDRKDRFHENCETVKADFEPLISEELFEAAQKRRQEIKNLYKKYDRQEPVNYALKGLVRCSACGATLTYCKANDSLQCYNFSKGQCQISHSIKLSKIEKAVFSKISEDLETSNFVFTVNPPKKTEKNTDDLYSVLIAKEEKKLLRIKEAYENGIDSLEEYKESKAKIQARIDELKKEAAPKPKKEISMNKAVQKTIDILNSETSTPAERNIAIRKIIDSIIYDRPNRTIKLAYKLDFSL